MTKAASDNDGGNGEMPLAAHIRELRNVLIRCGCAVIACSIPCAIYWKQIFDIIVSHSLRLCQPKVHIIYTAPAETIMISLKIAFVCGLMLASPVIFQQAWSFISPALYKREKVLALPTALASTFCFLTGIAFSFYLLPLALRFLTEFATGALDPFFKVDEYFGFLIKISLSFGFAFQLPVVAFVFSKMGWIDHKFLLRNFRYAIVIIFIVAAILTPPDVLSQIMLALPLLVLYALSILISFLAGQKK
ncbi:MAG: twin-arginine translocase subunit TatC [Candidatus Fibromonas sp.]|jgi:sec-independent protein translocase protein TatC|nr:twin-arginine translocase subunit TatC [Candidatus Fibromonas sp.]